MFRTVSSLQARLHSKEETLTSEQLLLPSWHSGYSQRGEPSDSELSHTHSSPLGMKDPLTSGSSKTPARPPNPLRNERSLHLTNSAQRLQERGYRRCARNTPMKKYPHVLPMQRRRCSTQDFFGQPYLHMSLKSRENSLFDRRASSSSRPIKAHAFTVSAETQGPNSTNSLRLFLQKEKEELTVRSTLLWDIPMRGGCAQTRTLSQGSELDQTPSHKKFVPHLWRHA